MMRRASAAALALAVAPMSRCMTPSSFTGAAAAAAAPPPRVAPAQAASAFASQVPFRMATPAGVEEAEEPEKVLFAKAEYALFTASVHGPADYPIFAIYCVATGEVLQARRANAAACQQWMLARRTGANQSASIVFPAVQHSDLRSFLAALAHDETGEEERIIVGPPAWQVLGSMFHAQNVLINVGDPKGLETAFQCLANTVFQVPEGTVVASLPGDDGLPPPEMRAVCAARLAVLAWETLFLAHKRFGTQGGKKTQTVLQQIIRRAIRAVNVFVVDVYNFLGKTASPDGFTLCVTIYNAQKKNNTVTNIRTFSSDKEKTTALRVMLFGEGMSSTTILVPTPRTKALQLQAIARECKPTCHYLIVEAKALGKYFKDADLTFGVTPLADPKAMWAALRAKAFPGAAKKHDDEHDIQLARCWTAIGMKAFREQKAKVEMVDLYMAAKAYDPVEDLQDARQRVGFHRPTFLNALKKEEKSVEGALHMWNAKIYHNDARTAREEAALQTIQRYLVVDLETTTSKRYKRIANPFTGENHIVLSGALDYKGNVFIPTAYFDKPTAQRYDDQVLTASSQLVVGSSPRSLFLPPLDDYQVIVGHNLKFDMHHLWRDAELRAFFQRGGKIWDTMYAEYLLTGHQVKLGRGAGLEDVAKSYGGKTPKLNEVKAAWAAGKQTTDIPYATLREYLVGDLKNTELIFLKHRPKALDQRQVLIVQARMDSLLATTEMEFNGLKTDVAVAIAQSNDLVAKATAFRQQMEDSIPSDIPPLLQKHFNWASNQHLIARFFGGTLKLNTQARLSKDISGMKCARHELFNVQRALPPAAVPLSDPAAAAVPAVAAVTPVPNLMPSTIPTAGAECAIAAGFYAQEKATRCYKSYFETYVKLQGFRKSSALTENVSKLFVAVPRKDWTAQLGKGQAAPVVNLLPKRHLAMYAAIAPGAATGAFDALHLFSPESGTTLVLHTTDSDRGGKLLEFLKVETVAHTCILQPSSQNNDPSVKASAFLQAQVMLIARDAPFSFWDALSKDPSFGPVLRTCCAHFPVSADTNRDVCLTLVDATATLLHYLCAYGEETYAALRKESVAPEELDSVVIPMEILPVVPAGTKKTKMAAAQEESIRSEAMWRPEEWIQRYSTGFPKLAARVWALESAPTAEKVVKKAKKNAPRPKEDNAKPLFLRERSALGEALTSGESGLTATEQQRLLLMMLFGRTCGSTLDAFVMATHYDEEQEVKLPDLLCAMVEKQLSKIYDKFNTTLVRIVSQLSAAGTPSLQLATTTAADGSAHVGVADASPPPSGEAASEPPSLHGALFASIDAVQGVLASRLAQVLFQLNPDKDPTLRGEPPLCPIHASEDHAGGSFGKGDRWVPPEQETATRWQSALQADFTKFLTALKKLENATHRGKWSVEKDLKGRFGIHDILRRLTGKTANPDAQQMMKDLVSAVYELAPLVDPMATTKNIREKFCSPTTRQMQVGDETLSHYHKFYGDSVADAILTLRQMEKLIGTYYEYSEGGTGMVSLVHASDSCIHHELQHNKTNTGRLASSNPNCQNIPKEDKSPLREMFVSRFGANGMCIEADYSQLEVITLAALANDQNMLSDLEKGVDFHCKRVTMIRDDLTYEEVVERAKKKKEPEFVKLRQQAKIFSFQRQYGAGVKMLSESTGLSHELIKRLIDNEKKVYYGCDKFTNMVTVSANTYDAAYQDGARNNVGHQIYKGMFPVITGSRYIFSESDMPDVILESKNPGSKSTSFSPTHIKNYPVQGFAGEIVQIMLGRLWRHFVQTENYGGKAVLTNTVHDCVWVDATKDIYLQVASDVERIMSDAKNALNELWPEMECQPKFPVDVVAGENMGHLKPIPKQPKQPQPAAAPKPAV